MSLATRCTACGTVFRVVQDQLKVSEGWVRCGRCHAVFNALEGLFDIEPEPVPALAPAVEVAAPLATELAQAEAAPTGTEAVPAEAAPAGTEAAQADAAPGPDASVERAAEPGFEGPRAHSAPVDFDDTPASRVAARDRLDFADAQFNSALLAEAGIEGAEEPSEAWVATPDATAPEPSPAFVREAEREARWQRPRTVLAIAALCGVLALALALQVALHFRDLIVATAPQTRPALDALCQLAGCRIEPLRRIEDIVIESSTLTSADGGDAVRLSVVLRNRGPLPLAMPAVELTLTDPAGQMIVRRGLSPADFGIGNPTLAAASEAALQLVLATDGRRATGYTVEPFYP